MRAIVRLVLDGVVAAQTFFAVAAFLQWPVITAWWPFPGTTPLTYIFFISSIFAATAAATLWAVAAGHDGALAGIGLDYLTILTPVGLFTLGLGRPARNGWC